MIKRSNASCNDMQLLYKLYNLLYNLLFAVKWKKDNDADMLVFNVSFDLSILSIHFYDPWLHLFVIEFIQL